MESAQKVLEIHFHAPRQVMMQTALLETEPKKLQFRMVRNPR